MSKFCITNVNILTLNREEPFIEKGHIFIENKVIKHISPKPFHAQYSEYPQINGEGKLAMPGLMNGHVHVEMCALHGLLPHMSGLKSIATLSALNEKKLPDELFEKIALAGWKACRIFYINIKNIILTIPNEMKS